MGLRITWKFVFALSLPVACRRWSALRKVIFDLIFAHARQERFGNLAPVVSVHNRAQSSDRKVPLMVMVVVPVGTVDVKVAFVCGSACQSSFDVS